MGVSNKIWTYNYNLLKEYYNEYGNIDIPTNYVVNNVKLGFWLARQKNLYREGKLSEDKIELLNQLKIEWDKKSELGWNAYYSLLKKYYDKNKNIEVPVGYVVNGLNLDAWLNRQKNFYKEKTLSDEKIKLLNDIGIVWSKREKNWKKNYELLKKYYDEHGDINIPVDYEVDDVNLRDWLDRQREAYRKNNLNKEWINLLNKLGMIWNIREDNWDENYSLLEEYYKEYGNVDVPSDYTINDVNLGRWVRSQRSAYSGKSKGKINDDQIQILNDIEMIWDLNETKWQKNYELLKNYYKEFKSLDVPQSYAVDDISLGIWLRGQRQAYKGKSKIRISKEHIKLLNDINIDWAPKDTKLLNKEIVNIEEYNTILLNRLNSILDDLIYEGVNEIEDDDKQKEITNVLIKRIWR